MQKVKAINEWTERGQYRVRPGDVIEVTDERAKELLNAPTPLIEDFTVKPSSTKPTGPTSRKAAAKKTAKKKTAKKKTAK